MCGINGIFGIDKLTQPSGLVKSMNNALAHRGPDAEGVFVDDVIALGHRRLAIIDRSAQGNQPFHSEDGRYVLVFNGEIYNYRELRAELSGYPFRTSSDTEVIPAAYAKWGISFLNKLDGMFAFALWDKFSQELLIARDRLGKKPLYFFRNNDSFVFSSEMRALIASGIIAKRIKRESLIDYLRYQTVHAPDTILENVQMLMPGHYMLMSEAELKTECYWSLTSTVNHRSDQQSYSEIKNEIRELLTKSVEKRLIADVPFGAFLSGGIDSSAVVALMAQVSSSRVKTFTISFEEKEFSEAKFARVIAEKYNTDHTEIQLSPEEFLKCIPSALNSMDHPSGDGPNTWLVSKVTKEAGISMALSGLGGDELFAGYDVFKRLYNLKSKEWLQYFPMPLRKLGAGTLKLLRPGIKSDKLDEFLRLEYFDLEHVYPLNRQVLKEQRIADLLNESKLPLRSVQRIILQEFGTGTLGYHLPELSKISLAEMSTYMQNVLLRDTDQMSMAHALEVRVPFLDYQLVEYVLGVSDEHKFPHTPKKLLVESLADLIPEEIVNRKKMGFTFPWKNWMKNELRELCESSMKNLSKREYFNEKETMRLWNAFLKNDPRISWSRIWHLVVLENWLSKNGIS